MKISIVIPTLNEAEGIAQTLRRAAALGAHEIIVSDGGSGDATAAIAQGQGVQVVHGASGRAAQQNRGAAAATGDALLFLHADCWLAPGALEQVRGALADAQVHCGAFRHRIEAPGALYRLIERGDSLRVRLFGLAYGDQGIFVRRETFHEVGGFADVPLLEDVLLMRTLRRRSPVALLPGPLYTSARRWQRHGAVSQTLRNWSILTAHRLGVPAERLAAHYRPHKP